MITSSMCLAADLPLSWRGGIISLHTTAAYSFGVMGLPFVGVTGVTVCRSYPIGVTVCRVYRGYRSFGYPANCREFGWDTGTDIRSPNSANLPVERVNDPQRPSAPRVCWPLARKVPSENICFAHILVFQFVRLSNAYSTVPATFKRASALYVIPLAIVRNFNAAAQWQR